MASGTISVPTTSTWRAGFLESLSLPLAGWLAYRPKKGEPSAIGVVQQFVPNQGDAWQYTLDQVTDFPANYWAVGTRANGAQAECSLAFFALGACVDVDSVRSFNPLMNGETTPFRDGRGHRYGTSVSGGSDAVTYYMMAEVDNETGVQQENEMERVNLRARRYLRDLRRDAIIEFR